ncbi:hypothetical protein [Bradyrhizobium sp. RDM4]|uniref:hypothetical protein n=1 Tax=Bradyrhizobium sp. RDM4 TaxID=3378765 RepID=UPI0038FC53E6
MYWLAMAHYLPFARSQFVVFPAVCSLGKVSYSADLLHFAVFDSVYLAKARGLVSFGLWKEGSSCWLVPVLAFVLSGTAALSASLTA